MRREDAIANLLAQPSKRGSGRARGRRKREARTDSIASGMTEEDRIVEALHHKDITEKFLERFTKIMEGRGDVRELFDQATVPAILEMMNQMRFGSTEKIRREAAQDFLDRAGHTKVQKIQTHNTNLTSSSSESEIESQILGLLKETRVGKVVEAEVVTDEKDDS